MISKNEWSQDAGSKRLAVLLRCGASALALAAVAAAAPAFAQDAQTPPTTASDQPGDATSSPPAAPTTTQAPATDVSSSTSTSAKNPSDATVKEVVVTGIRASLATSQAIKKNSDTVVDSITATDINAFPDKSVAEALQRVAGITVSRFAATSDTTHFSAEPSSVIVRGLQQVRSEFNGRDVFNANSGRGLGFGDVSPELMAGVDAYKNLTPDMIEGGVAGTINLRTRLPFDQSGQLFSVTADALWGDLARKVTPDASALYSNRWSTEWGDFGILGDIAYSDVKTDTQGIVYGRIGPYVGFTAPATATTPNYGADRVYIPSGIEDHDTLYDRTRTGIAVAGQWRSPDHKFLLTGQYNESKYNNVWQEHAIGSYPGYSFYGNSVNYECTPTDPNCGGVSLAPYPAPGTAPFTFDKGGMFTSGVMTTAVGWWGTGAADAAQFASNSLGQPMVNPCYNNADNGWGATPACTPSQRGPDFGTTTRYSNTKEDTGDGSINLKWDPTDNLHFNFDFQHIHSTVKSYDMTVMMYSYANVGLVGSGDKPPQMSLFDPTNVNFNPGGLENASNYYLRSIQDHLENSEGDENAFRADGEYDFNTTWLDALKFGYRYADRNQTVRWSTYNWANVANNWTQFGPGGIPQSAYWNTTNTTPVGAFTGYPADMTTTWSFPASFYNGNNMNRNLFPFMNMAYLKSHDAIAKALGVQSLGVGTWDPLCSNFGARANELPGQCYNQSEIDSLDETTQAGYLMLRFGGRDARLFGIPVSGNIGVRYVHTQDVSTGGISLPLLTQANNLCTTTTPYYEPAAGATTPPPPTTPSAQYSVGCYLYGGAATQPVYVWDPTQNGGAGGYVSSNTTRTVATGLPGQPKELAFNNGANIGSTARSADNEWLPAFNVKFQLTDTWQMRFAYSRAMSRPDIGLLKNYTGVGVALPGTSNPVICQPNVTQQAACFLSSNGQISGITGVQPFYSASAYNPYLKPIKADQFDFTLENYFAKVGQFSVDVFYKKFLNYIQYGSYYLPVTNSGETRTVLVRGPVNTSGASVEGAEVAFQRFFDFLPGAWSGLGMQANFTYVHNSGLQNSNVAVVGPAGQGASVTNAGVPDQFQTGTLEALSKYAFNLVGMYEKGPISLRLAYNWRSEFLVTALDCCTYLPMWQKAQGFLDGSIRYKINDHMLVDLEATNLLGTETILEQQVTDLSNGRKLIPSSWFKNDRRFQVGVQFKF